MKRIVPIYDDAGAPVTTGVTTHSAFWVDTDAAVSPTPDNPVLVNAATGQWAITIPDPAVPRGPAMVALSYNPGSGTFRPVYQVDDLRIAAGAILDKSFVQTGQAAKAFAVVGGGSKWNPDTNESEYYAADGSTILITDLRDVDGDGNILRTVS